MLSPEKYICWVYLARAKHVRLFWRAKFVELNFIYLVNRFYTIDEKMNQNLA